MAFVLKLLLSVVVLSSIRSSTAVVVRTCEGGSLDIACDSGSIIRINSANYGRTAGSQICPDPRIQTTNCRSSNSFNIVSNQCDGDASCTISASNGVFGDPCRGTYKYLEVDYTCEREPECDLRRTCEGGSIDIHCPADRPAIHVCDALYGRQVPGSALCPDERILTTNCDAVTSFGRVRGYCQGKSSCSVAASNNVFGDPCVGTYKYLEINYLCARRSRVCEGGNAHLSCSAGQTILVLDGFYGRTAGPEICPHPSIRTQNCRISSSLPILKSRCDGQNSCTVGSNNSVFGDPCPGTYKYLEVLYECA